MTDRVSALLVVLEENMREDDVENIIKAIQQMRQVQNVCPAPIDPLDVVIAESRVKAHLTAEILKIVYPERFGKPKT